MKRIPSQKTMPFLIVLVFFLTVFFSLKTLAFQEAEPQPLATVDIITTNNRNVAMLTVQGEILRFVLDTGATKTSLFQSEDRPFDQFERVGTANIIFPALNEKVEGNVLAPLDIHFGDYVYRAETPLLIRKRPPIGDRLNFAFDGVIGQDFFNQFVVEIDPDRSKLSLYRPGTKLKTVFKANLTLHIEGTAPYIYFSSPMPWEQKLRVKSTPQRKKMLLDTGYPGVMVFWKKDHIEKAVGKNRAEKLKADNTGIFTRATFKIGTLRFISAPIFLAPNVPLQMHDRDGIIGSNVLNSFHHVIDFPGRKLALNGRELGFHTIDGAFYPPNNEGYIYKDFKNFSSTLKTTINIKN